MQGSQKSGGMAYLDLVQLARAGKGSTQVVRGLFWSCLWIPRNTGSLGALRCTEEEDPGPRPVLDSVLLGLCLMAPGPIRLRQSLPPPNPAPCKELF